MTRRPIFLWILAGGVGMAIVTGSGCRRDAGSLPLPALTHHPGLPVAFGHELQHRREQVVASANAPEAVRSLANLYHANRLYEEAQVCYELMARQRVNFTARDHYYLADIAQNRNDLQRAQTELRAVIAAQPDYIPARLALAETLFKSGQAESAEQHYAAVVATKADQPQASVGLARIELQRGDDEAAVTRLEELVLAHPESTAGAALLAQLLQRRGDVDRAVALREMSRQRPEPPPADPWMAGLQADLYDIRLLGLAAEDCFRIGDVDTAQALLDRLETLDPTSATPSLLRGQADALAHRHEVAVGHYRRALDQGGDPGMIGPELARLLLALDRANEAATLLAGFYAELPDSLPIAKAYADALVQQGDDGKARPVLAKVLEREPYARAYNMHLARILWTADERDAAVTCLQRVATAHVDDVASRALLGEYHLYKADPVAAVPPLEQARKLATPQTPEHQHLTALLAAAYLQAGGGAATRGHLDEAADLFARSIAIAADDPRAHAALAHVAVRAKQYARAGDALENLARLQPENPTILLSLGDVLHRQGEPESARQRWERALPMVAPGDARLRHALEARLRGESPDDLPP